MRALTARILSVHAGDIEDKTKSDQASIRFELDGVVGDRHRSFSRKTWAGDKQPKGTVRRNERQWSAVSKEELREIADALDLRQPLLPSVLGANLCLQGIKDLSRLPKGTLLKFPSGAELCVEEYNPPCLDMGTRLAETYRTRTDEALTTTAFSNAARLIRGIVGVVEVPGDVFSGDEVTIELYEQPSWLTRSND
ncbi:MAG: MOSC domain-containing protein [Woeseiaceae bacterium]